MELYRAVECVEYAGKNPAMPVLRIGVTEPVQERSLELTVPVDTGFAGYVLLDRPTYEDLGTAELPREQFGMYQTMAGPVVLRRSRVTLRLGGRHLESYVETPLYGVGRSLLGRSVLSKVNLAVLGVTGRCCYLNTEE